MLLDGDVEVLGTNAHRAGNIVGLKFDGIAFLRLRRGQRAFQHAAEAEGAPGDPDQLRAAVVQLQLDAVAVRREREQGRQRGQRLRGH